MRRDLDTHPGKIYQGLQHLIRLRKSTPLLGGESPIFIETDNPHVSGYIPQPGDRMKLFPNIVNDDLQQIIKNIPRLYSFDVAFKDLVTGKIFSLDQDLTLAPFQCLWLNN